MKKRLLAMLLVLMMVVSLLPTGALADGDESFANLRLMDQDEWEDATFERAGVYKGRTFQVRGIRVYDTDDAYTNLEMAPGAGYYYTSANYEAESGKAGKLDYKNIDRMVVAFTQDGQAVEAVFHRDEFDVEFVKWELGDWDAVDRVEVTLKDNLQTPAGPAVWFYAPIGGYSPDHYVLYDVVYLNGADTIGSNMPSLTNVGSTYDLVCWQIDRTGAEFTTDTVVTTNIDVYAKKVTGASDVEHIRAQNNNKLIFRKALQAYNATYSKDLTLDAIDVKAVSVYGTSTETNPYYDGVIEFGEGINSNQWHGNNEYYAIFNINVDVAEVGDNDERCNERVEPDDIKGIRLYAKVNGEEFVCSIPRSELDVRVNNITWVDIYLREDSEPDVGPVTPDVPGDMNGRAFEIAVYVDEEKVDDPLTYINLPERVNSTLGWNATPGTDGHIVCDYEYKNYDCADVKIKLKNTDKYYIQGIMYGQSYGEAGANSVSDKGNGVYVIDNMCDADADAAGIYIYTKYSVEYYLDNSAYKTENDGKVYVINRRIGSMAESRPGERTDVHKIHGRRKAAGGLPAVPPSGSGAGPADDATANAREPEARTDKAVAGDSGKCGGSVAGCRQLAADTEGRKGTSPRNGGSNPSGALSPHAAHGRRQSYPY